MKHVRTFETHYNRDFEVGDIVMCEDHAFDLENTILESFLYSNVGEIVEISNPVSMFPYYVKYENIPDEIRFKFEKGVRTFSIDEIRLATAEEIEQYKLEQYSNKYNL